jgi:hypothetical protein
MWTAIASELVWATILIVFVLFVPVKFEWYGPPLALLRNAGPEQALIARNTIAWGCLGGILSALYHLYKYGVRQKRFEAQYLMWYVVQPVIGAIVGQLTAMTIGPLLMAAHMRLGTGISSLVLLPLYLAACAGGYRQRYVLEFVDRLIQFPGYLTRIAKASSEERAAYREAANARKTPALLLAVSDYWCPPRIDEIDLDGYRGRAGDQIIILARDNFQVTRVEVWISHSQRELIEQGNAVHAEPESERWIYTATQTVETEEAVWITALAHDLADNTWHEERERSL